MIPCLPCKAMKSNQDQSIYTMARETMERIALCLCKDVLPIQENYQTKKRVMSGTILENTPGKTLGIAALITIGSPLSIAKVTNPTSSPIIGSTMDVVITIENHRGLPATGRDLTHMNGSLTMQCMAIPQSLLLRVGPMPAAHLRTRPNLLAVGPPTRGEGCRTVHFRMYRPIPLRGSTRRYLPAVTVVLDLMLRLLMRRSTPQAPPDGTAPAMLAMAAAAKILW